MKFNEAPERLQRIIRHAQDNFKKDHNLHPVILGWKDCSSNMLAFPVGPFMNDGRKHVIEEMLIRLAMIKSDGVALVCEQWALSGTAATIAVSRKVMPRDHVDRIEQVGVIYEAHGELILATSPIDRNGKEARLGQWTFMIQTEAEFLESVQISGGDSPRFQGIFYKARRRLEKMPGHLGDSEEAIAEWIASLREPG